MIGPVCFCKHGRKRHDSGARADRVAFPQIILNGELVGGLDIFKEMLEDGSWDEAYEGAE